MFRVALALTAIEVSSCRRPHRDPDAVDAVRAVRFPWPRPPTARQRLQRAWPRAPKTWRQRHACQPASPGGGGAKLACPRIHLSNRYVKAQKGKPVLLGNK
jgi:hypothetical protein